MKNIMKMMLALVALTVIFAVAVSACIGMLAFAGGNITDGVFSTLQTAWMLVALGAGMLAAVTAVIAVNMLVACFLAETCKNTPIEKVMESVAMRCAESLRAFPECLEFIQTL